MRVVTGRIAFTSFHLLDSVSEHSDSYLALAFADADDIQLVVSKMQRVKLQLFFIYMSIASRLLGSKIAHENDLNAYTDNP